MPSRWYPLRAWDSRRPLQRQNPARQCRKKTAVSDAFMGYAWHLRHRGRLDRIVVDECHVVLTASEYRHKFAGLDCLRARDCQLVYLTATLPLPMELKLEEVLVLGTGYSRPSYVRDNSDRPNFAYGVEEYPPSMVQRQCIELMEETRAELGPDERAVLFTQTKPLCEAMANLLKCEPYHAGYASKVELMRM